MNTKRILPVIHCVSLADGGIGHTLTNVKTAREVGADGVFLIGHSMCAHDLGQIYEIVRKQHPNFWVGMNFLDLGTNQAKLKLFAKSCHNLNALWMDRLPEMDLDLDPKTQVFGGVAFKYVNSTMTGETLREECLRAEKLVTVPTTSGDATGLAPSITKLTEIRRYLKPGTRLAVASGVDALNFGNLIHLADDFLVASSISYRDESRGGYEYLHADKLFELLAIKIDLGFL